MTHLSITFPDDLKVALDKETRREHTKRSTLIQKAVRVYLELKKRRETRELLKEGYQEMSKSSIIREIGEDFKYADAEAWENLD